MIIGPAARPAAPPFREDLRVEILEGKVCALFTEGLRVYRRVTTDVGGRQCTADPARLREQVSGLQV
jgi:hypothetical protein